MNDIWETLTDEKELSKMKQRRLSLIFLFIACVQIFIPYDRGFWDTIKNFETELLIMPDFTSGFLGILIIVPLYARNILKWNRSNYTLIKLIMFILIFSSLIKLIGVSKAYSIIVLSAALALSWLGIKAVAGLAWILLFAGVIFFSLENINAMGFCGWIYLISVFVGLILHSELSPSQLTSSFKEEFFKANDITDRIKSDVKSAAESAAETAAETAAVSATVNGINPGINIISPVDESSNNKVIAPVENNSNNTNQLNK